MRVQKICPVSKNHQAFIAKIPDRPAERNKVLSKLETVIVSIKIHYLAFLVKAPNRKALPYSRLLHLLVRTINQLTKL
jgi:hypothetical protein